MRWKIIARFGFALGLSLILAACDNSDDATDYSVAGHWLALPSAPGKPVDVFYLYPTAFQKANDNEPNICEIDNPSMLAGSKEELAFQATAFETVANIYAPYYRQVDAAYCLKLPLDKQAEIIGDIPASDAIAAFDYYINHYNQGRPFILAGHSQGSNVMLYLLSDYMRDHPEVYARMIAAYVVGYSITPGYLAANPHLKFAAGPADTGVIVSYNTEAPVVEGNNPVLLPGAQAINPINWTRTGKLASAAENLGSRLVDEKGNVTILRNYADARVDTNRGVVICSTVDVAKLAPGNPVFGRGVFHEYDYQLYYFNLRANAADRIAAFHAEH